MKKTSVVIISLFILFLLAMGIVLFDNNLVFDEAIYQFIISFRCSFLDKFFIYFTRLGDTITIIGIVLLFLILFRNKDAVGLVVCALFSVILNNLIKYILRRPRPDHLRLIVQGGYSFPSGHAMISVFVYGYLLYLTLIKVKNKILKILLSIFFVLLILLIGISRIYVGVHYPTDVLAGYFLALAGIILIINFSKRLWGNKNV